MTTRDTLTWEWWIEDGNVCVKFYDLDTQWNGLIKMTPQGARDFARTLIEMADKLENDG